MATKNSTRSTSNTRAPAINLPDINPLIPSNHVDDTIVAVSEVLSFLSNAMDGIENRGQTLNNGSASGMSRILDTCRAALTFHLQDGGAA
jgi:hypothetical protein